MDGQTVLKFCRRHKWMTPNMAVNTNARPRMIECMALLKVTVQFGQALSISYRHALLISMHAHA
jgi:hypothetical protein